MSRGTEAPGGAVPAWGAWVAAVEAWAGGMGRGGGRRYPQESRPDGKKILERLSQRNRRPSLFEISKKHPIEDSFNQIQEDLRNQYSLGYTPDHPSNEPGYHKISLTVDRKDLIVQARDGYYSSGK